MDWIKDKKNQPIIIGLSVVIFLGAIGFLLFQFGVIGGSSGGSVPPPPSAIAKTAPPMPGMPTPGGPSMPGRPPGAPMIAGGPSMPGRPPGAPMIAGAPLPPGASAPAVSGVKQAAVAPKRSGPADPFKAPANALPATLQTKPIAVSSLIPFVYIARTQPKQPTNPRGGGRQTLDIGTPEVSTTQRMSGVLFTDKGIVGLLETNGQTQQVYPGDTLNDGSARVISIQSDGLILRRTNDSRLVRVPLSSVSTGSGAGGDNPVASPPDNGTPGGDTANPGNDANTDNL